MQVKRLHIDQIKEGMIVAEDIYTDSNALVLMCNTVLNDDILKRLRKLEIYRICIYEPEDQELTVEEEIQQKDNYLHKEKIRRSEDFKEFKKIFDDTVLRLEKSFARVLDQSGDLEGLNQLTGMIASLVGRGHGTLYVLDMLNCMREYDDVTFAHCISVSILCRLMGEWQNLPESELHVLTLCGLLHDVGKLQIPSSIISKPGKLTEEEYLKVQEHPMLGYETLKGTDVDERVKLAALMHHERCDGKGYPLKIASDQIEQYSKIVMIADVYDAMTADRSYRAGMCPFEVLRVLGQEGYQKYDPRYLVTFMERTAQSYINSTVRLSDQRIGEVISVDLHEIARPLLRVDGGFVDLKKEKDLNIVKII